MKTITTIVFTFLLTTVYGQNNDSKALLDSAKTLFKSAQGMNRDELKKFDYTPIVSLLEKVIKENPDHVEARYYLGYTYSRMNSKDASGIMAMNLELVLKSSEQFERVIKLSPMYEEELIVLDPYSKITAEWGSMALFYWLSHKTDSAHWAFREGKKRGGFGNFVLEINRKALDTCSRNAILISSGDNNTFPLYYLQIEDGYRKDVSLVDISLLNTTWYPTYLSQNKIVAFDIPDNILDTLDYIYWPDTFITINDFSWKVKPTFYEHYILRGDQVLLSLIRQNKFKRDMYFTKGFYENQRLSLADYLTNMLIVDQFTPIKKTAAAHKDYKKSITNILQISKNINTNSTDELMMYDHYRLNLLEQTYLLFQQNEKKKAQELMIIWEKYADEKHFPYLNKNTKEWADYLKQVL